MEVTTYDREQGLIAVDAAPPSPPAERLPPPAEAGTPPEPADASSTPEPGEPSPAAPGDAEIPEGISGGYYKRFRTIIAQRNDLRTVKEQQDREIAQLRAQLAMLPSQPASGAGNATESRQSPTSAPPDGEPRWDTYNGDSERYWRDLAAYQAKQVALDVVKAERQRWEAEYQQAQQRPLLEKANARVDEGHIKFDDFDETLTYLSYHIPQDYREGPLVQFLAEDERGAEVCDYLAKHPEALQELNDRKLAGVVRYLKSLSKQLERSELLLRPKAPPGDPSPLPPAPPQASVPPVRPLTGTGQVGMASDNPRDIAMRQGSVRDYIAARERERLAAGLIP